MDSAQKNHFGPFFDLGQSEKLSDIKPPLSCYLIKLPLLISLRDILMCMLKGFPQDLFPNTLFTRLWPGLRNNVWSIKIRTTLNLSLWLHEYVRIILLYGHLVYFIWKAMAWESCNIKWGFAKQVIISHKDSLCMVRIFMDQTLVARGLFTFNLLLWLFFLKLCFRFSLRNFKKR